MDHIRTGRTPLPDLMLDAAQRLDVLAGVLETKVSLPEIGTTMKTPYRLLVARAAMAWRMFELATDCKAALEAGRLASAFLLARGSVECASFVWWLDTKVAARDRLAPGKLEEISMRALVGARDDPEMAAAIHVNDMLREVEKMLPGALGLYGSLSERAHPNYAGAAALFSTTVPELLETRFGATEALGSEKGTCASALCLALSLHMGAHRALGIEVAAYVKTLPRIWPDGDDRQGRSPPKRGPGAGP